MPWVETKSKAKIIEDYELLQEINEKWRKSKTLAGMNPTDAKLYDIINLHSGFGKGIIMWSENYVALLSSKDTNNPKPFIELMIRNMENGDIIVLFSKSDYEAAKECKYHIKAENLKLILEE